MASRGGWVRGTRRAGSNSPRARGGGGVVRGAGAGATVVVGSVMRALRNSPRVVCRALARPAAT